MISQNILDRIQIWAVKETIKLIKKIFPIRSCSKNLENIPLQERECLNFHINRCLAPCQNYIDDETYNGYVKDIIMFLNGKYDSLVKKLVNKMKKAARAHEYEKAAGIRNQIEAVKKIMEQQKIVSTDTIDQDVIGYAAKDKRVCITIFFVRNGKLIGKETFFLTGIELPGDDDIIESFIKQFYTILFVPKVINVQEEIEDVETIEEWLSEKKGAKVNIRTPKRGEKRKLLEMVIQNAKISLEQEIYSLDLEKEKADNALKELASYIDLDNSPARIEALISQIFKAVIQLLLWLYLKMVFLKIANTVDLK